MGARIARGLALLALAAMAACTPRSSVSDGDVRGLLPSVQATTFGDSVQFVLQVTNTTGGPVELEFRSGQEFDFVVERAGEEVWRWSADRMFTQALRSRSVAAGETLTFSAAWTPPASLSGDLVVRGVLQASDRRIEQQARFRLP